MLRYSGLQCNTPPSMSARDSPSETIIPSMQAISDSGNTGAQNDYSKILDGDELTHWTATSGVDAYVVFDSQMDVKISSFSMKPHDDALTGQRYGPLSLSFESGLTPIGPWTNILDQQYLSPRRDWIRFEIVPFWQYPFISPSRYYRLYVHYNAYHSNQYEPGGVIVSEMEFFTANPGIRGE